MANRDREARQNQQPSTPSSGVPGYNPDHYDQYGNELPAPMYYEIE